MDVCARIRMAGVLMTAVCVSANAEGFYFGLNAGGSKYDVNPSDMALPMYAAVVPATGFLPYNPYGEPFAGLSYEFMSAPVGGWSAYGLPGSYQLTSSAFPCSIARPCPTPTYVPLAPVTQSLDTSDTALKFDVGYRFNRYFAAELSYADLGVATYEAQYNLPGPGTTVFPLRQTSDVEVDGIGVSVLGSYPFSPRWSMFLRGGYFFGDAQVTTRTNNFGGPSPSYSADNAFASTGIDFSFAERWGVRVEYQRFFDAGGQALRQESDIDTWSLGLQYRL